MSADQQQYATYDVASGSAVSNTNSTASNDASSAASQNFPQSQNQNQQSQRYYYEPGYGNMAGYSQQYYAQQMQTAQKKPAVDVGAAAAAAAASNGANAWQYSAGRVAAQPTKPRITTTYWEDEGTVCYQVEANSITVSRREDSNFINGTKLLNVAGMTRGRRDGILKSEKARHVVKIGAMNLKGVWIPFERAFELARNEGIADSLYPLFVRDIKSYFLNGGSNYVSAQPAYPVTYPGTTGIDAAAVAAAAAAASSASNGANTNAAAVTNDTDTASAAAAHSATASDVTGSDPAAQAAVYQQHPYYAYYYQDATPQQQQQQQFMLYANYLKQRKDQQPQTESHSDAQPKADSK